MLVWQEAESQYRLCTTDKTVIIMVVVVVMVMVIKREAVVTCEKSKGERGREGIGCGDGGK